MLDVTVCILSYNRPAFLREALLSVLAQSGQPKGIAIYDNGSNRDVHESIKDILRDRVQWVGAELNHPFVWNFSRAMLGCETRYVMMLHDDDRLCPNFLEAQIKLLEANTNLAAISCNGYYIDERGNKTGSTLVPTEAGDLVEQYTCSGQVALKYAGNSCIPLSPAVYRTDIARSVKFREEFGKVCDAVFFCDLAEIKPIAYQTRPLYECRAHSGQDSSHFPYELLNLLEEYFWSRKCVDEVERNRLHALLLKQHAARNLRRIFAYLGKGNLLQATSLMRDSKFSLADAVQVIAARVFKNNFRKW